MGRKELTPLRAAKTAKPEVKKPKHTAAAWLKPLSDYKRHEAKAFGLSRFG
jgi:hypothetical protein